MEKLMTFQKQTFRVSFLKYVMPHGLSLSSNNSLQGICFYFQIDLGGFVFHFCTVTYDYTQSDF